VQEFKDTYVYERRVLERFRLGPGKKYKPSPRLDGKSRWDTPEETRALKNQWDISYKKLTKVQEYTNPTHYVRILFRILRGSAFSIPTLNQLATGKMMELVGVYLEEHLLYVRQDFVAESERAQSAITVNHRGSGFTIPLAVYYTIVDDRLELSPLFKYCLAVSTVKQIKAEGANDEYCERLTNLAKRYELLAAMDYTLFPEDYDYVWGSVIPESFRVAACNLIKAAVRQ